MNSSLGLSRTTGAGAVLAARPNGFRFSLPVFSFVISMAIVLVSVIAPSTPASANDAGMRGAAISGGAAPAEVQLFQHPGEYSVTVVRDNYTATAKPRAPIVAMPDPGSAKAIAYGLVMARGWGEDQYGCLVALWERESHWNAGAANPYSGAYGIPQALPGNKMASAGADWQTNPATQISWGLGYITARYSTPCGAWQHSQESGWY